ncbi:MAG: M56 family metallopeptidase [Vicinamibacterales bacterium]
MNAWFAEIAIGIGASFVTALLAKATLTLAVALAVTRLARRSRAAARHVLLVAAFAVLLALPAASFVIPSRGVTLPAQTAASSAPAVAVVPVMTSPSPAVIDTQESVDSLPIESPGMTASAILWAIWGAGMLLCVLPVVAGTWHLRSLRRSSSLCASGEALLRRLSAEAGIQRSVAVRVHESIPGPMTYGILRPVIMLPLDATAWSEEELCRAMIHELEHVRRGDWLSQYMARIVRALYWFHPLVWIAWRRLSLEAERACDDAVLRRSEATAYANQLVLLAERLTSTATPPLLAMAACRDLSTRVRAVLDGAQARGRAGALPVTTAIVAAALFIAAVAPLRAVRQGQVPSDGAQQPPPAFETASVKPNKSGEEQRYIQIDPSGTNLKVVNMQLRQLITWAYQIQSFQLEGGPDWIAADRFDILAKPERAVPATGAFFDGQNPLRMMFRTLLADRFKLVMHKETKELPIFELVVARQDGRLGPQLRPAAMDCAARAAAAAKGGAQPPASSGPPGSGPCFMNINPISVRGGGVTLAMLANILVGSVQRLVIDRTGLTGNWDLEVNYTPDQSQVPPGVELPPSVDRNGPSLYTALEEQLGLKLRPARGPVEVLVIDSVQQPTPN